LDSVKSADANLNPVSYERLKTEALIFRRSLGLVELRGPDRITWLQGMVSNDVARLTEGQGCYAAHLSPQGKVLSQMVVLAEQDALWLAVEADNARATIEGLDKMLVMEDAELFDRSSDFGVLSIAGNGARSILERWSAGGFDLESPYAHGEVGAVRVVRADLGYDLIVPAASLSQLHTALVEAGALIGDEALWESIRIEGGIPVYGVDVDATTTLPELGEKGIDYKKGCYIGQEVVAKIRYIGHVNRRFIGLRFEGAGVPQCGAGVSRDGREVGRITSSVYSPYLQSSIALAYVRLGADKAGTTVEVPIDGKTETASVTDLPFVSHRY
jgi:folate-binding protein YgfZ